MKPRTLGSYRVLRPLGQGGMGEVFLAVDDRLERRVAIKRLRLPRDSDERDAGSSARERERLRQEARALARLNHPFVVQVHELFEQDADLHLVMELVEGETVARTLERGPLDPARAARIASEIATGLAEAHEQGILHRDLKAENVMITAKGSASAGHAKILDFGLAKVKHGLEDDGGLTDAGTVVGTCRAMSPEQVRGEGVDERSDLFSLGVLLYEMVTGKSPFLAEDKVRTLDNVCRRRPPPASAVRPDVPAALSSLIGRLLAKEPRERPESASWTAAELARIAGSLGQPHPLDHAETGTLSAYALTRPRRPLRPARLVAGGLALLLAAGGLWAAVTWPRPLGTALAVMGFFDLSEEPSLPDEPSVVVLPFANLGEDPEQEVLSDGLSEDVTTDLATVPHLFLIARESAFSYKGRTATVRTVGRELGVRYVLGGSVRRSGDRLRVTAHLADATTGFEIWRERYDRELTDIFALQSEISEAILGALHLEIEAAELARIRRKPTEDLNAYEAYLRGKERFLVSRRAEQAEARSFLERAVRLDPDFAAARALLARTYSHEYVMMWDLSPELPERLEELTREALRRDPEEPEAVINLAIREVLRRNWAAALLHSDRAVEISPNHDLAHLYRGFVLSRLGRHLEGLRAIRRAWRLNPVSFSPAANALAGVQSNLGREAEAREIWEAQRASNPDEVLARILLAVRYEREGRHAEARKLAREVLSVNPRLRAEDVATRSILARDEPESARSLSRELERIGLP